MDNEVFEGAFEPGARNKKSLRVYLINPPSDNPWRTKGEYEQDQAEARERHAMFQEQHAMFQQQHAILQKQYTLLHKQYKWTIGLVVFTAIMAFATCALVGFPLMFGGK